jgi:hypothetical protein
MYVIIRAQKIHDVSCKICFAPGDIGMQVETIRHRPQKQASGATNRTQAARAA